MVFLEVDYFSYRGDNFPICFVIPAATSNLRRGSVAEFFRPIAVFGASVLQCYSVAVLRIRTHDY